tara:strand:+ start:4426 stop:5028 length:603 start_codon:yes stop_codon:yes gene_type:complete
MILLIDVVSPIPVFHIIDDNKIVHSENIIKKDEKLSFRLIPVYLKIKKKFNLDNKLKKLIITIGPGSYTAMRVGSSFAAGLSKSMSLTISMLSSENIYEFYNDNYNQHAIFFESSNNQCFLSYKKKNKFFHKKIENNNDLSNENFRHIIYNIKPRMLIHSKTSLQELKFNQIIEDNLKKFIFKKNVIIKPIYISNNPILN